ncbi:MAG: DUF916 and DUF3324 domain-containing protein [Streptococcaceae bacterium]|jgi:LPXTG-motif cell wall-anchored protein|nr:DUF916 and DUF3324 domain-containing protein [Streptococcaceae bacterium]
MKKFKILYLLLLPFLALIFSLESQANSFSFSVNPILPDNQAQEGKGYFDLLLKPGEEQTLTIQLLNNYDTPIDVVIELANATTNLNGVVEYNPNKIQPDATLKFALKDLVNIPSAVTLAPHSTKNLEFKVTMPKEEFDGLIAGGITFKDATSQSEQPKKTTGGYNIINEYQYVVGLSMQQTTTTVKPDLSLHTVKAAQFNGRNIISANLQNAAKGYLFNMRVDAQVTGITHPNIHFTTSKEDMQMAPNTNFDFPIPVSYPGVMPENEYSQPLQPGRYKLVMSVWGLKDEFGKYKINNVQGVQETFAYYWHFEKEFVIEGDVARALNASDPTVKQGIDWYWYVIIGLIVIILLLILWFLLWKRRKNKDDKEVQEE